MGQIKSIAQSTAQQSALAFESIFGANFFANLAADATKSLAQGLTTGLSGMVQFAARTEELGIAEVGLSRATGLSIGAIKEQELALKNANIATQTARESLSRYVAAGLPLQKVSPLAAVAKDLAVIAGVNSSEEFDRLIDGITTLQIRVLRSAGVYVSLRDEEKKFAEQNHRTVESLSEQEKQQIALNAVINFGTRATGLYELAMTTAAKQQRSLVRIQQDFADAVGGQFIPVLGAVVALYGGFLKIFTASPEAFTAVVLGVTAFTAAVILMNSAQLASLPIVGQLLSSVSLLTRGVLGLATAEEILSLSVTQLTLGWVGLALVIAGAAYAIYKYSTQQEDLTKVTLDDIKGQTARIETYKDTLQSLSSLGGSTVSLADKQKVLTGAYEGLDAVAQARVRTADSETAKIKVLAEEYGKMADAEKQRLELVTGLQAQAFATELTNYDDLIDKQKQAGVALLQAKAALDAQNNTTAQGTESVAFLTYQVKSAKDAFNDLGTQIKTSRETVKTLYEHLQYLSEISGKSVDDLLLMKLSLDKNSEAGQQAVEHFHRLALELGIVTGETDKAVDSLDQLVHKLGEASTQSERTKGLHEVIAGIAERAGSVAEARTILQNARGQSINAAGETVDQLIGKTQQVDKITKSLDELVFPKEKHERKRQSDLEQLADSVKKLQFQLQSFQNLGSRAFDLRFQKEDLERTKKDYDTILGLRHELLLPLTAPLPTDTASTQATVRELTRLKEVKDAVTKASEEQLDADKDLIIALKTQALPVVDAQTRAMTAYAQAVRAQANADQQLTADVITQSRLREDRIKDEAGSTFRAYQGLRLDLLNENKKIADDLKKNQVLSQILSGDEKGVQASIEGFLQIRPAEPPSELKLIADASTSMQKDVAFIATKMGSTGAGASFTGPHTSAGLAAFGSAHGFRGTSGFTKSGHNVGSLHYQNLAEDFSLRGKTPEQIEAFIEDAVMAGVRVVDEATRPKGQAVWGGPNLHLEFNAKGKPSYLPRNPKALQMERDLRAGRGAGAATATPEEAPIQGGTTAEAKPSVEELQRANYYLQAQLDRVKATVNAKQQIMQIEESMKVGLIAFDDDIALARAKRNQQRVVDDRATAINIKLLEDDIVKLKAHDAETEARVRKQADAQRLTESKAMYEQLIVLDELYAHYGEDSANRIAVAYKQARNAFVQVDDLIGKTKAALEYLRNLKAGDTAETNAEQARQNDATATDAVNRYREILDLQRKLFSAAGPDVAARALQESDRYQLAWLHAIAAVREADINARESIIADQVKIADATVYHADQANQKVMDVLASQKSLTDAVGDFKAGIVTTTFNALDSGLDKLTKRLGAAGSLLRDFISSLLKLTLIPFFQKMLIGGGTAAPAAGGTGTGTGGFLNTIFGGLFGGGTAAQSQGSVANFFGGGGTGGGAAAGGFNFAGAPWSSFSGTRAAGAPMGSPAALQSMFQSMISSSVSGSSLTASSVSGAAASSAGAAGLGHGATSALSTALGGKFSFGNLVKSFGAAAPLIGASLGGSLGGSSVPGQILGTAGGLLGGLALGIGTGSIGAAGSMSTLIASLGGTLAATGIFAGVAVALLVGSLLLGRNKLRRQEETQRTAILTDSKGKLQKLLDDLRAGRIDGHTALAQADAIRADYLQQVGQLKDKKTRNIAIATVRELDAIIANIKTEAANADQAAERFKLLVPTFDTGGSIAYVSASGARGASMPSDHALYIAKRGDEAVVTHQQVMNLGGPAAMAAAGVPGYGQANAPAPTSLSARSVSFGGNSGQGRGEPNQEFYIVADEAAADAMVRRSKPGTIRKKMRLAVRDTIIGGTF